MLPTKGLLCDRAAGRTPGVPLRTRSDAELIADLQATDGDACWALFDRYARLVYRVAHDILRDAGEAEDVTQEVFLEIYRKAHLYDPARGSVRVWFLQYAYHRTLGRKTALRRRAAYRGEPLDVAEPAADPHRRQLSPEECRWVIRAGLAQLTPKQRLVLELACFEGLGFREIAAHLGVSLGCARHYYYRGLARLRTWAQQAVAPTRREAGVRGAGRGDDPRRRGAAAIQPASAGSPHARVRKARASASRPARHQAGDGHVTRRTADAGSRTA
jgi:RNA polymerase sigma-70 factor, ECF subfamily